MIKDILKYVKENPIKSAIFISMLNTETRDKALEIIMNNPLKSIALLSALNKDVRKSVFDLFKENPVLGTLGSIALATGVHKDLINYAKENPFSAMMWAGLTKFSYNQFVDFGQTLGKGMSYIGGKAMNMYNKYSPNPIATV